MNKRWVLTYINKDGMRTLMDPAQGRFTYATEGRARHCLDSILRGHNWNKLPEIFGAQSTGTFDVREVECHEGHNDPKTCWFDTPNNHLETEHGLWYFWDETESGRFGPYMTRAAAVEAMADYARRL